MKNFLEGIIIFIFLMLAPFNLGYYSYRLIGEFIDNGYQINTPTGEVAGINNSDFKEIEKVIPNTDNFEYLKTINQENKIKKEQAPIIVSKMPSRTPSISPSVIAEENFSFKPSQLLFICIKDNGEGDWILYNSGRSIANIDDTEALYKETGDSLILSCQRKLRLYGLSNDFSIKRIKDSGEAIEEKLILEKSYSDFYLELSVNESSSKIEYKIKIAE